MLDLEPAYLTELQAILKKYMPNKIIWAYGSRVKGKAHSGSDLDLTIIDPDGVNIPPQQIYALKNAIEESNLPILVDVLDWTLLPEAFQKEIEKEHVVLVCPVTN